MVPKHFLETKENKPPYLTEEGGKKRAREKVHMQEASNSQVPLKVQAIVFIASYYHVSPTSENLQFSLG